MFSNLFGSLNAITRFLEQCIELLEENDKWKMKLDKFHLFPELPVELRLAIWGLAAYQKRVIEVSIPRSRSNYDISPDSLLHPFTQGLYLQNAQCSKRAPVIYYACREAREVVISLFHCVFTMPRPVYMNLPLDELIIRVRIPRTNTSDWGHMRMVVDKWARATQTPSCDYKPENFACPEGAILMVTRFGLLWEEWETVVERRWFGGKRERVVGIRTGQVVYYVTGVPRGREEVEGRSKIYEGSLKDRYVLEMLRAGMRKVKTLETEHKLSWFY